MIRSTAVLLASAIVLAAAAQAGAAPAADLGDGLAGRSEEDKARDPGRKPADIVAFLGVEKGMTVLDLIAAGGWYTEVLSVAVGPEGRVYSQNTDFVLKIRDGANDKALTARLANGRLANVQRVDSELADLPIADGSVDVAITALNLHDIYNSDGGEPATLGFLAVAHRKLKPGGVLGIIDHVGVAGQDNAKLHRMQKQQALDVIAKSGFTVVAETDVLANPADDHTQNVFAPDIRGRTDRFALKLRKK